VLFHSVSSKDKIRHPKGVKANLWNLDPPENKPAKYTSPPWRILADGYLIDVKPHLHDGAVNMTFYLNGKNACSSRAIYGGTDGGLAVDGQK
jgi:hypothetical protein